MNATLKDQLIEIAIRETPSLIAFVRERLRARNPSAADPTDAEVIEAYEHAFRSSLAKDARWLAAHPS